jgi:hypothetical protein
LIEGKKMRTVTETQAVYAEEWLESLQREGLVLFAADLMIASGTGDPPAHVDSLRAIRDAYARLRNCFIVRQEFSDKYTIERKPVMIAWPIESASHRGPGAQYRTVIGLPAIGGAKPATADGLARALETDALSHAVLRLVPREAQTLNRELIDRARDPESRLMILPASRLSGDANISPCQRTGVSLALLEDIRKHYLLMLKVFKDELLKNYTVHFVSLGMVPALVLAILPTSDIVEQVLASPGRGKLAGSGGGIRIPESVKTGCFLRRATLCIPNLGARTSMAGTPEGVLEDLEALFDDIVDSAAKQDAFGYGRVIRQLHPLGCREGSVICSQPTNAAPPVGWGKV